MLNDEIALDLTEYLRDEREYVPWMSALHNLGYFASQFSTYDSTKGTELYTTYKVILRHKFQSV